jgi:hypothetical protein
MMQSARPKPQTAEPSSRWLGDERGAVMVLGIFMCACLVGVLWYLAGIGDAVVYRQRLQEAADATAARSSMPGG